VEENPDQLSILHCPRGTTPHPVIPSNARTDEERHFWLARQILLGIDPKIDILKPTEIVMLEDLTRNGQQIHWIGRSSNIAHPSNDFIWLNNNYLVVEGKYTSADYRSIATHISRSARRAANWGIEKQNFLVDIGHSELSPKLTASLQNFNVRQPRPESRITRLFLLQLNGSKLTQIDLE
jgi:hypothetical protein